MLVLMALEDMLGELGCTSITVAGNIEKGLRLVATQSFDLATLDLNLNGKRSYPIAKALIAADVPFAFSTGYGEHGVDVDYGNHPVLNKPFSASELINVVTALLTVGNPPALAV